MNPQCNYCGGGDIIKKGLEHNSNCMERENSRIKQRYKFMRGFKVNESGELILQFMDILYNLTYIPLNKKKTPAEMADIKLNLGRNRLLDIIKILDYDVPKSS